MAIATLTIPTRSHLGVDPPVDVNTVVTKVNEISVALGVSTLSIPGRTAGAGTRDLFRTDMNALRAKIDSLAAAVNVATTGLSDWSAGYDVTGEAARMNAFVTKVNAIISAYNTTPPPPPPTSGAFLIGLTGDQIRARPGSGAAFTNVKARADELSTMDFTSNSSVNGSRALACGLMYQFYKVSNPTLATTYRNKVINGWTTLRGMSTLWMQVIIRQVPGWVYAADLAEHRTTQVLDWCDTIRYKTASSTAPSVSAEARWAYGLRQLASDSVNNHGTLGLGAFAVLSRFVNDTAEVDHAVKLLKGWLGVNPTEGWLRHPAGTAMQQNPTGFTFTAGEPYSRTWTENNGATNWSPLGPSAALYPGQPLQKDGVVVDDISRDAKGYSLDAQGRPVPGQSGIQYTTTAMAGILQAANALEPIIGPSLWTMRDSALRRWRDWLQRYGPWDDGRVATSFPYVHLGVGGWMDAYVNKKYGTSFTSPTSTGYSLSFFDWLL